ncbi:MerR family transcriptional regulator [Rhodobacter capsulatus]|jgi:DNA-binding transcriptional MerR regulator|uniref:Transcriptional regulator, MerR family n=1 Tax=Rhodobacter capsulatus (strain ATCC BAA-309 / NBRC 16581 / SB1003) TaxID=272942 RepID=D5AKT1_RHOCB|nr:helix-turn-helix domain-containing protein [Rhodobacter capsulatus]ADE85921.1 transcriptional regulator, MerR family [Rhodobacter capsulatus SB 1003]ETD01027.1 MerR family transcriptional regulator [Rhodobacter capsulatus DE442]ETD75612.1 MerR family transcriptional regulator [Rhodobacter capsulatus R121]ETE53244.1 MerR family transcriptional regulator [Rhodobacter capsulatus Y262]MDS0927760.1 helix-turn-helix domain-containing protein [Rhodobacter capsulatus]
MLSIGRLSQETGVKVPTIRYYEQIGLMPAAERSSGNQRLYGAAARRRLSFIRHARDLGFPLEAIRDLLGLTDQPDQPCTAVDAIARAQLTTIRSRIARLQALEDELVRMIGHCTHGRIAECRVIEVLGDHGLCAHDHHGTPEEEGPGR